MKRIIAVVMILFLVLPGFAAAAPRGEEIGNGGENPAVGDRQQVRAEENETAGREEVGPEQNRLRTGENETAGDRQRAVENTTPGGADNGADRNRARLAVHVLLAAENRTGGIGENISAIARELNNSVQATARAEERIQARHTFMRFLFGGDADAARLIEGEVQQNRERAAALRFAVGSCTCDEETRTMLREQIRTIEQEQERLLMLADAERRHRGLLQWG
jgi:hypothetical protein